MNLHKFPSAKFNRSKIFSTLFLRAASRSCWQGPHHAIFALVDFDFDFDFDFEFDPDSDFDLTFSLKITV
jgi:hypothetical protein